MPKVCLETPEVSECISRPVAMQVIRQMATRLNIPNDISVRYLGMSTALAVPGSTLDDHGATNRLPADQKLTIEVTEEYVEDNTLTTAVMRPEHEVVFADSALRVYCTPVYQRIQVAINVTLIATDKTSADTWISNMRRRSTQGIAETLHLVDYHYPIPQPFIVILGAIHDLRESNAGYGQTIGEWLQQCLTPRATTIVDQAGTNHTLVVNEGQVGIVAWFDWTVPPKSERENDSGTYSASFTYTFHYDRVESSVLEYPLMVHNQLLDARYYSPIKPYEMTDNNLRASLSTAIMRNWTYEARASFAWRGRPGIPIPQFDDWLPPEDKKVLGLLRIMLAKDPSNPNLLLNLTDLGVYSLHAATLDYMRQFPAGLVRDGESLFTVQLWDGLNPVASTELIVNYDLTISTIRPLDTRRPYHLTVGLIKDLRTLSKAAIQRLTKHGELAITVLSLLDPYLVDVRPIPLDAVANTPLTREQLVQYRLNQVLNGSYPVTATPPEMAAGLTPVTTPSTITTLGGAVIPNPTQTPIGEYADRVTPTDDTLSLNPYSETATTTTQQNNTTLVQNPALTRSHYALPVPRADGSVALYELTKAIALVNSRGHIYKTNTDYSWGLVGALTIHAHRST